MNAVVRELRANCAEIVRLRDKLKDTAEAKRVAEQERDRAQLCIWNIESERAEIKRQLARLEDEV